MVDPFRRNYGAGDYNNTSNNRFKDTLAKASSILLDDPFSNDGLSNAGGGFGVGGGYGMPPMPSMNRPSSQAPISHGGYTKSNYTGSEAGDLEFDTNSQFQQRRRQWGNPLGEEPINYGDEGFGGFKSSGGGDLAGINEIGTLDIGGSRRGSFRAPAADRNSIGARGGSESKDRMREPSGTSQAYGGIPSNLPRPNISTYDNNPLGLRRPQTSEPPLNLVASQYTLGGGDQYGGGTRTSQKNPNNPYSEIVSSYKDEDDALSHYMGQSEYGGASNIGGAAIPTLDRGPSNIPSRRMAAKQNQPESTSKSQPPQMQRHQSTNYGLFLSDDTTAKVPPSIELRRQQTALTGGQGSNQSNDGRSVSPPQREPLKDLGFGRPQTGLVRDRSAIGDTTSIGGRRDNSLEHQATSALIRPMTAGIDKSDVLDNSKQNEKLDRESFAKKKQREDIERFENELKQERERTAKLEQEFQKQIEDLKEKNKKDLESIEESQKLTLTLLMQEKEKTMETLQEAIAREKQKMEVLHQADLESKERQHQNQLEQQKRQLEKETQYLEQQLAQQQELKEALEKVQQRTGDLSELVSSSLKQREEDTRRKEQDLRKRENQLQEEDEIELAMEEKRLEEEERKLQKARENMLKSKSSYNDELERLREQRKRTREEGEQNLQHQKQETRTAKDFLALEKQKLETETDKYSTKKRIHELELQNKENEVANLRTRIDKEKVDFEMDIKERYLREIQVLQIKSEERRNILAEKEGELRKKQRFLEKKRDLLKGDWEDYHQKAMMLESERKEFEEWADKIRETSLRLNEEKEKVLVEKSQYDFEREKLEKWKMDLDLQRSILQSDFIRAEELEHELDHREKMLSMLKFNKDQQSSDINIPPYSSCPALKIDPRSFVMQQSMYHHDHSMGPQMPYQNEMYMPNQQVPQNDLSYVSAGPPQQDGSFNQQPIYQPAKRFDYTKYVQEIQSKLGSDSVFRQRHQQSFNQYLAQDIDKFRKDMSHLGVPSGITDNEISLSHNAGRRPEQPTGYQSDSLVNSEFGFRKSNGQMVSTGAQGLREQIQARLGKAQLSESKQYDSSGVEEQENEDSNNDGQVNGQQYDSDY